MMGEILKDILTETSTLLILLSCIVSFKLIISGFEKQNVVMLFSGMLLVYYSFSVIWIKYNEYRDRSDYTGQGFDL